VGLVRLAIQIQHVEAGGGHIINVKELALGCTGAPDGDLRGIGLGRLVEAPNQGRDHVAVLWMEIVAGPVEVGRHYAAIVPGILAIVALAQFDASDLGDGIGLIGGLERAGE